MTRKDIIEANKARRKLVEGHNAYMDSSSSSWFDVFIFTFSDKTMDFDYSDFEYKVKTHKYSERTYRLFYYIIYWFTVHKVIDVFQKDNLCFDRLRFQKYSHNIALCWNTKKPDEKYVVCFKTKAGMPVVDSIGRQYNSKIETFNDWLKNHEDYYYY